MTPLIKEIAKTFAKLKPTEPGHPWTEWNEARHKFALSIKDPATYAWFIRATNPEYWQKEAEHGREGL